MSAIAAWTALTRRGHLQSGEQALVLGASGVVGQVAVQAAKLLGAGRAVAASRDGRLLALALSHSAQTPSLTFGVTTSGRSADALLMPVMGLCTLSLIRVGLTGGSCC